MGGNIIFKKKEIKMSKMAKKSYTKNKKGKENR